MSAENREGSPTMSLSLTQARKSLSQVVFDSFARSLKEIDGSKVMSFDDFSRFCKDKGYSTGDGAVSREELAAAFVRLDTDGDGMIKYEEFFKWFCAHQDHDLRRDELRFADQQEQEHTLRSSFNFKRDTMGCGVMNREQFRLHVYKQGYCLSDWELEEAMVNLDKSGDGLIDFAEYLRWFSDDSRFAHLKGQDDNAQYINQVGLFFRQFDKDFTGHLTRKQFEPLYDSLQKNGEVTASLEQCLAEVDANSDGKVSINEFLKWYTTPYPEEES